MILIIVLSLLQAIVALVSNSTGSNELFVLDGHPRGRRAVLVNSDPNEPCRIYGHSNPIQVIENLPDGPRLRTINQQEWLTIAADCQQRLLTLNQKPTTANNQIDFIYPGTKWCGTGDVANNFKDLGPHAATDMCCRDHDFCQDTMKPGTCKYGLCNTSVFTKSHCDCDDRFRQCLLNAANDPASVPVGFIYFDVGFISCYRQTPDCVNKVFREPIELTRRKKRQNQSRTRNLQNGWCFIPPQPFKKSAMVRRNQPDGIFRHVLSTMSDVSTMVKQVAGSTLSVQSGK
ncbi:phospholipase A2-like [Daphnia pulex]|uniref:phospholipase A2-like n=1 Tax=Daphnia pulex TaxID=6669 RepID=UPI001EE09FD7|nr:phospholipase A2-like [Daphnia pulex]